MSSDLVDPSAASELKAVKNVWLWWSSGKDSAWTLEVLRADPSREVSALVTTTVAEDGLVAMHRVRQEVLRAQAELAELALIEVELPWPCPNEAYEQRVAAVVEQAVSSGVSEMAFGDLFLQDIRRYREGLFEGTPIRPIFPLWHQETADLARRMVDSGLDALIVCLDPKKLEPSWLGRRFSELIADLPEGVDPCGENGELHTCVVSGPMFREPLKLERGSVSEQGGFLFLDVYLAGASPQPIGSGPR